MPAPPCAFPERTDRRRDARVLIMAWLLVVLVGAISLFFLMPNGSGGQAAAQVQLSRGSR